MVKIEPDETDETDETDGKAEDPPEPVDPAKYRSESGGGSDSRSGDVEETTEAVQEETTEAVQEESDDDPSPEHNEGEEFEIEVPGFESEGDQEDTGELEADEEMGVVGALLLLVAGYVLLRWFGQDQQQQEQPVPGV
jgi:hypothetical protein